MKTWSKERWQAISLAVAALLGLALAPFCVQVEVLAPTLRFFETYLVPLFFIGVGLELRQEFSAGLFVVRRNLIPPLLGAILGVATPAVTYILVAGLQHGGWSVPTATDITIGLALLTAASPILRSKLRARFLALATIDDLIGLAILLLVFSQNVVPLYLILTAICLGGYWLAVKLKTPLTLQLLVGASAILISAQSGVQTSIIGVLIGFMSARGIGEALGRVNGWLVVPGFAFLVTVTLGPAFNSGVNVSVLTAILLRPIAKLIGISLGGVLGERMLGNRTTATNWVLIGVLGGVGLTVSLLLAQLAHAKTPSEFGSAVVGTLLATAISAGAFLVIARVIGQRERQGERSL